MKPVHILKFNLLVVLFFGVTVVFASTLEEKKKVIEKSYKVDVSTSLKVSNQFGEIHLEAWDKSELKVKVEIIVNGKTADRAEKLLDKIAVDITEGGTIAFYTELSGNMNTKSDESFEINYWINFPATNDIDIENQFGDTYIDDWKGRAEVEIGYGNLKTQDFSGFLELELSFGKGSIGSLSEAEVDVKYSELSIQSATKLDMEQQFSQITIEKVGEMELESKYGDVKLGEVDNIESDAQFSGFSIEKLNKRIDLEASYVSDFEIGELNKDFSRVEINGKYSSYTIRLQDGTNAEFEGEFSYANMSASNDQVDIYYKVKDDNRNEYKAKIGKGSTDKRISVESSYGNLKIK